MSKSIIDDITTRKLTMVLHARNHVDVTKDKHTAKAQREAITTDEALGREILVNQALVDLLVSKGIFSREELQERIEEVKKAR